MRMVDRGEADDKIIAVATHVASELLATIVSSVVAYGYSQKSNDQAAVQVMQASSGGEHSNQIHCSA
jgi:hypothetical protein